MARVTFSHCQKTWSGKVKGEKIVLKKWAKGTACIAAKHTYPRLTDNNHLAGKKLRAALSMYRLVHENFKKDLQAYAYLYETKYGVEGKQAISKKGVFYKAVLKFPQPFQTFTALTSELGTSVWEWYDNGYLPYCPGMEGLTAHAGTGVRA